MSSLFYFLTQQNNPFVVALSMLIVCLVWWGVFVIESTIRSLDSDRVSRWRLGQSLMLGFGIWAFHFVGMVGWEPGFKLYFDTTLTFTSLLVSLATAYPLVARFSASEALFSGRNAWAVSQFAIGLGGMHYLGVFSAQTFPVARWNLGWVVASVVLAYVLGFAAIGLNRWKQSLKTEARRGVRLMIAGLLGLLLFGVHYVGVVGASFSPGTVCISNAALTTSTLTIMVIISGLILIVSMIFISAVESRLESRLQDQNRTLKTKAELLEQMIQVDRVTTLPNIHALEQALSDLKETHQGHVHLIKLKLIGFESLCDSWGQEFGDKVINLVKQQALQHKTAQSVLYRSSESEFELLLVEVLEDIPQLLNHLYEGMTQPMAVDQRTLSLGCQIGCATAHSNAEIVQLPAMARSACDYALRSSASWCCFEPHMLRDSRDELEIQARLREAIRKHEFKMAYQPKVDATTGELVGAEALMRWRTGDYPFISPAKFIPIAEKFGLISVIGDMVLNEAMAQQAEWLACGLRLRMSINLSTYQFEQTNLVDKIAILLNQYQLPPALICFEITETAAMLRPESTLEKLNKLRALGVELSLDDFGTGYSSMSLLHALPINELKIDRSFVLGMRTGSLPIIRATIQMAKDLRIRTVAEGVETEDELSCLQACEVDEIQGYLVSKPMFGDDFLKFALIKNKQVDADAQAAAQSAH